MQNTVEKFNCVCCFSKISSYPCPECGFNREEYQPDPIVLPVGSVLQDRYVIGGVIGKGGFGITYLAYDKKLERKIAVKEYYPYGMALRTTEDTSVFISGDDGVFNKGADKFYNEAKMIARFNSSPNIVNIFDFFYENCTVYYVMEYLRGRTLRSYVENIGCLTPGQAVYIALEISDALTTAHSENILHRDISPDNIMLCSDGKVKLIDFGAARQVASEYSKSLSVILTQGFAPLEQYQKKGKQGPWTDIYSLGASLYYGLTGCVLDDPMSRSEDDTEFEKNPFSVTEELWTVIRKAVMLKIPDRQENAAQFRDDLKKLNIAPEKVKISEAQIKSTLKRISRSDSGKAQSGTPASKTMPAKSSSQMQTMPAKSSSQMRTMPVSNSSQIRTMPIYDESSDKARSETPHETANSVRNKLIPIISALSTAVVMLIIGIIFIVVRDDETEIVSGETDSASVSTAYDETEPEESSETVTSPIPAANEQPEPSEPKTSEPKTSEPETPEKDKPEGSSRPDRTESEPSAASQPKKDEKPKKDETEAPKPETEAPKPVTEAPKTTTQAPKPTTEAPKPVTEAPKPVTEAPKPVTEAPKPVTEAPKTTTQAPKPQKTEYTIAGKTYSVSDKDLKFIYVEIQKNTTSEELSQLVYLPYLESLSLTFYDLTKEECEKLDLSFLGQLSINRLNIWDYKGKDLSFLQCLEGRSSLKKMSLNDDGANISDFSALKNLTHLERLWIWGDCDNLTDLSFLKNYDSLKDLEIKCKNVKDISGIEYVASTLEDFGSTPNSVEMAYSIFAQKVV